MFPIKKILCTTDFSDPSFKALIAAREMAEKFKASLMILHVVEEIPVLPALPTNPAIDVPLYQEKLEEMAMITLETVVKDKIGEKASPELIIGRGKAAETIVETAVEKGANLIVIGTHGETGFRHFVLGSVTEKVVRLAKCPVLTVHAAD
ncbi:MAG: universal stress protein [Deltaproteobacteria bacterium]|uniref:Universal stress protein n=1 Tax=Candidatus Zymogenus saltonus TaxID=2844893 RepID=A0A9D8KEN0_9DELT|nr:universal stress protein [Candidatus Zymogenus saltonus]